MTGWVWLSIRARRLGGRSLDQVGIGVVGSAGVIGRKHAAEAAELPNTRLVAVHDLDAGAAGEQAAELGARFHTTLDDLLDDPEIDAVTIATPHPLHMPVALDAFSAGKHVLTEKPITATPSEADRMVSAAAEAGVKLGVVYQNRFRPDLMRIHEMAAGGELGELYRTVLDAASFRSQAYYDSGGWRGTWDGEGGGVLLNQGIHYLDMFQWLGGMPAAVTGHVSALTHDIEVEDSASALLEYPNGAHGFLHCNTTQAPSQTRLELWGDKCGVVVTDDAVRFYRPEVGLREFSARENTQPFDKPEVSVLPLLPGASQADHKDAVADFAQAVIEDREPAAPGEEGVKGLELAAAVIYSGCIGEQVKLPLDRDAYDALLAQLRAGRKLGANTG